jgi:hypothetical protein
MVIGQSDMSTRFLTALAVALALMPLPGAAAPLANQLFGEKEQPSRQEPMPVGTYAKGCAAGLVELPESGPSWQAMRLSRNRNYGHPVMIDYISDLSRAAQGVGWAGLYVGDISQPRGGPMTSGHASHQIGLDADIWMLPPRRLNLSRAEVHGVVSFYHDFRTAPAGRHLIRLCRAEACQAMGADRVAAHAQAALGIDWHETTPDGAVTLEPVFCLGLCACAPAALIDGRVVGRVDAARLDALIAEVRP